MNQLFLEGLGRYYLPLPKLTSEQVLMVSDHLTKSGFKAEPVLDGVLRARAGERRLSLDPSGVAWSNMDLLDVLAPCVPELLRSRKVRTPVNPFFLAKAGSGTFQIQFLPRIEARRTWRELRRSAKCGLTPDERYVIRMLLEGSSGQVEAVTDFPLEDSRPFREGRRSYFRSTLDVGEFGETLRVLGDEGSRSSYLPISGLLVLRDFRLPSRQRLKATFEELGEWCFVRL